MISKRAALLVPPSPVSPYHHNILTLPRELTATRPGHSFLFNAYADPPTTTLQRIKGITTGSLPTFVDIGNNFAGSEFAEDSILKQLKLAGRTAAFMGDDTWLSVFPSSFAPNLTFPYDSFNVEDLHTVDTGVITHLFPLLSLPPASQPDLVIGHFLGVDHVGHRLGPDHPSMKAKLTQMDEVLRQVMDVLDDDTLLVVLGDHGMDRAGDHGGDGALETSSALWIYSKGPALQSQSQTLTQKPKHVHKNPPSGLLRYTTFPSAPASHRSVQQIDLLPTLCLLLGLPIPFGNLGSVIPELFWRPSPSTSSNPGMLLKQALEINTKQIKTYLDAYRASPSGRELDDSWESLERAWINISASSSTSSSSQEKEKEREREKSLVALSGFNDAALRACRAMWAQFNAMLMVLGLVVLGVGLASTWGAYVGLKNAAARGAKEGERWVGVCVRRCVWGAAGGAGVGGGVYVLLRAVEAYVRPRTSIGIGGLDLILFSAALGSSLSALTFSPPTLTRPTLSGLLALLHTSTFLSNSYTFWEDRLLPPLLLTSLLPSLLVGVQAPTSRLRRRILGFLLLLAVCARLISASTVCREEQGPGCRVTFFVGASEPPLVVRLLAIPVAWALPSVVKRFLKITRSEGGVARVFLPFVLRPVLVCGATYWLLEWLDSAGVGVGGGAGGEQEGRWRLVRTWVARLALGWGVGVGGGMWWVWPLCLDINVEDKDVEPTPISGTREGKVRREVTILGFANAFGASYAVFWCVVLGAVWVCAQLTGQVVLALGVTAVLAWAEVVDSVRDARGLQEAFASSTPSAVLASSPGVGGEVSFGDVLPIALLGMQMFFGTGHQATVSSIQWKSAFLLTSGVKYPWSVVTVVLNSLGGLVLAGVGVPLVAVWNKAPRLPSAPPPASTSQGEGKGKEEEEEADPERNGQIRIHHSALLAALAYTSYFASLLLGAAVSAAILRRHLMVWKVFAPRFMFGVLGVVVADVCVLLGVGVGVGRVVNGVGGIFGRMGRGR
ncbi:putative type I phosphodiesterase / nucleotide pyrophosphatase [Lyophyllum shimeji]|uniref:Type I phosphodiesterase / nucleotide pyrophosphatase n=1 Tax=Lyophyllum shimeji TaxID=47721 RepID=A0A9P3URW3_LYOSH|nr:putative type I phosphodiesterase / nucleotide pyrophosphatase [Lyophyllum shimeji]